MSEYTPISKDEMDTLLIEMQDFEKVDVNNCMEIVYERDTGKTLSGHPLRLRVYSSVDIRTEYSRPNGKDAIRVVLMWKDRFVCGTKRVHRIETWAKNLLNRIETIEDTDTYICIDCEIPMVVKKGKFGRFYGCTNFPRCKHSFDIPA